MIQARPVPSLGPSSDRSAFVPRDAGFGAVLGDAPRLVRVVATDAHEGPVYVPAEDALYFTSVPRRGGPASGDPVVAVRRLALDGRRFPLSPERVSTVREDANVANGMALDRDGRLVVCEQGTRSRPAAITRDGRPLVSHWKGRPLNSPNDVVVKGDGSIWFTDPQLRLAAGLPARPDGRRPDLPLRPGRRRAGRRRRELRVHRGAGLVAAGRALLLPVALGDGGGRVASGFNAPNRVLLTRDARPGQTFQIAVFGINGPISASPRNYIWMRTASLDF